MFLRKKCHLQDGVNHESQKFFSLGHKVVDVRKGALVNIICSSDWKDHGQGSPKQHLELELLRPDCTGNLMKVNGALSLFGNAKHQCETKNADLSLAPAVSKDQERVDSFFEAAKEGDIIKLWRCAACGGNGNELFARILCITFCFVLTPKEESAVLTVHCSPKACTIRSENTKDLSKSCNKGMTIRFGKPPSEAKKQCFENTALVQQIGTFVDIFSSEKMRRTNEPWKRMIPRKKWTACMQQQSGWYASGDNFETKQKFFIDGEQDIVVGKGTLVKITASCDWKDQGWGNIKGSLELRLLRADDTQNTLILIETLDLFGTAKHQWERKNVEVLLAPPGHIYRKTSSFLEAVKERDVIQLW
eukprot:CAMPEP_0117747734 /NCGR_PEP_ID=MMETSP0947-20121206/8674_1 /TAXON_ID=44440 /ORGANISM="Chattonella subsalsa, Strain CCMP2191" /LENGTH=360 /DNA_ID=CAMNT_0005565217 /DNA_START=78 /DNA_END=1157 /DNA_ORIENTATION=+